MLNLKTAKTFILIGAIVIVLMFTGWQIIWLSEWENSNAVATGVKISGFNAGGYETEALSEALEAYFAEELSGEIMKISYEDIENAFYISDFVSYYYEDALAKAYSVGRTGNTGADYMDLLKAKFFGLSFEAEIVLDESALQILLKSVSEDYYIAAQDAYITSFDPSAETGQRISYVSQVKGQDLDIESSIESIKAAVTEDKNKAEVYVKETDAAVTDEIIASIDSEPIESTYTISNITSAYTDAAYQVAGSGRYEILYPGQELSIIEFFGQEDYIYFQMSGESPETNFEDVLTVQYPTQIYLAALAAELEIVERTAYDIYADNVPAGTATVTNKYNDMIIKNTLDYPVIVYVNYELKTNLGILYCQIYRTEMEYNTYIKSVRKYTDEKTDIDIVRVYTDNEGDTQDIVVLETLSDVD